METQPSKYIPARDNRQPRFVALNQKSALLMAGSTLRSTHVSQAASLAKGVAVCSSRRSPVRRRGDHTATLHRAEWLSLLDLPPTLKNQRSSNDRGSIVARTDPVLRTSVSVSAAVGGDLFDDA